MNFDDPDVRRAVRLAKARELLQPGRAIVPEEVRRFAKQGQMIALKPGGEQDALDFRTFGYELLIRMADQCDAERTVRLALEQPPPHAITEA